MIVASDWDENGNHDTHTDIYRESNGTPGLQTGAGGDLLVQHGGYNPADQQLWDDVPPGTYTYYGFAEDRSGAQRGPPVEAVLVPDRPPTIESLTATLPDDPGLPQPPTVEPGRGDPHGSRRH